MITPAHVAASVLIWRDEKGWWAAGAVGLGALLPDLPMYGFYAYQKLWAGMSEREICHKLYFEENWQLLFDLLNSIPLTLLAVAICHRIGCRLGLLLAGSAVVHMLCDLPLHHDDAHRHFLPLTNWRLESPISYWDPQHYGHIFAVFELLFGIAASVYVAFRGHHKPMRMVGRINLGFFKQRLAANLFEAGPQHLAPLSECCAGYGFE